MISRPVGAIDSVKAGIGLRSGRTNTPFVGLGLDRLLARVDHGWRRGVAVAVCTLLVLEYRPATWNSTRAVSISPPLALSSAYRFLAAETDRRGVVELPLTERFSKLRATGYQVVYENSDAAVFALSQTSIEEK